MSPTPFLPTPEDHWRTTTLAPDFVQIPHKSESPIHLLAVEIPNGLHIKRV